MQEKQIIHIHRVGSVTFGLVLVVMGVLCLLRLIFPLLDYELIFRLWPVVFICLGVEVLISSRRPERRVVYDGAAIFLLILLILFAMSMAGMDWIFTHYPECSGRVVTW
ncbi:MAG: hypothetical protein HFI20_13430 [Lachnospiraceae bacterium]|jgi:hypothetical protein|nr:hypothetical protein [Lachnospiraceae bacterium]MCI9306732.1 hypothetical protein [Lachnospiraceae bacterium]MCI9680846.1 hypothetical protein [Lachnospiraceae bacterium]